MRTKRAAALQAARRIRLWGEGNPPGSACFATSQCPVEAKYLRKMQIRIVPVSVEIGAAGAIG